MREPIETPTSSAGRGVDRRTFLSSTAFVGGCVALSELFGCAPDREFRGPGEFPVYPLSLPENLIYTTCLQCHVDCQLKAKIWDGALAKIDGSPYSPQNYLPHLPYETPPAEAAKADGKLCAKGQAGIQTYYDPYRLRKVLKRAGPRGSNKWRVISFEQFVEEVVRGGKLFADIGDERHYPGFEEVYAVRDAALSKALAADGVAVGKGEMTVEAFKEKHREHLDKLIDPDHPDLGPKNNQFVFLAGRIEHGRKELMKWFTHGAFGSVNAYEHTTICEQSHHIAFDRMTGGKTHHLKPDLRNCEFVIFWGTGAFTANFGLTPMAEKVTDGKVDGRLKTAVVDPRLSHDAGKADWWLPVTPGADGALALWIARWIIERERYDRRFLENANRAAAAADGESCWTNATHLVKIVDGRPAALLTAREAGLGDDDRPVVVSGGSPRAIDPFDDEIPAEGDLFFEGSVGGHAVKTAFKLFADEAMSRSEEEYAEITGVRPRVVHEVARELTSHGKRAAVELYRGPVQHTDGFWAGMAVIALNLLIGNPDWRGGLTKGGGHWHEFGGKPGNLVHFSQLPPGKLVPFGPRITREKARYEDTTLFREQGYPAKRQWYPFTSNVYQEVIPSFAQGYPYPGKILFLHKGTPVLATPAGTRQIEMLRDPDRVPLFIACDVVIGETSMYADYILPDLTYLERWGTPHVTPDVTTKTSKVRQPAAAPLTEEVEVDGRRMPLSMEAFLIAVGKRLGLAGFGEGAFGPGTRFDWPEDFYLRAVLNIAAGDKEGEWVPEADDEELRVFREARRHLPPSVFDEERWKSIVGEEHWRRVVYVLNRGGRFAPPESAYDGDKMKNRLATMLRLFVPEVAAQKNALSGEPFPGYPLWRGQRDASGRPLERTGDYPFRLVTYKEPFGGHSRTIGNYWSNVSLQPENHVLLNRRDAERLGLSDGDRVRLVSPSNPEGRVDLGNGEVIDVAGRVRVVEGIRPGVVAVSWHYGHWAYGSNDVEVDGVLVRGDPVRRKGLCPNPVMALDPVVGDVCLTDPVGGSASFFDSAVRLEPAET